MVDRIYGNFRLTGGVVVHHREHYRLQCQCQPMGH